MKTGLDEEREEDRQEKERLAARPEHAVISTFDLFSIGGESEVWHFSVVMYGGGRWLIMSVFGSGFHEIQWDRVVRIPSAQCVQGRYSSLIYRSWDY
jgi:hypothetical protein